MSDIHKHKPLSEAHSHLSGFMDFLPHFNKETERGAALAAAAMLDAQLGRIIEAFLISNKGSKALFAGFNAPLGAFSERGSWGSHLTNIHKLAPSPRRGR